MAVARDKFWMFGVRPHQDDVWFLKSATAAPKRHWSRITPAEGAFMLDVPNMALIICDGVPVPYSEESYGYAESFSRMKKIMWGAAGSGGFRCGNEERFIVDLSKEYPNITGTYLDDFIGHRGADDTLSILRQVRSELDKAERPLEINVTWYFHLEAPKEALDYIDSVTMWTWHWQDLAKLEDNFFRLEDQCSRQKKILGVYMFDFPSGEAVPLNMMEKQCEFGLKMLKEKRIDGMMFEANSVMGIGLESEKWLTQWIDAVKYETVPD